MTDTIPKYPLQWPGGWPRVPAPFRKPASFGKSAPGGSLGMTSKKPLSISDGVTRIARQLDLMGVRVEGTVISTNLLLRLDGYPRSGQGEPADPGVAVYWEAAAGGRKVMAIDIYARVADNLAAIAATLDAMRAIERHGGAQILERAFTGFTALPPPRSPWVVLGIPNPDAANVGSVQAAYRAKVRTEHPDVPGGSHNKIADLNWARDEALRQIGSRA